MNALGQRIEKAGPGADTGSGTRQFVYDEAGHLIGEYDAGTGAPIAEHFFLDDWPVGVRANSTLYNVHPDHLGTPRAVTRADNEAVVWYWDSTRPFGGDVANENPSGLGSFSYNLRFPGQYFDGETGKHYNYFRDYDPTIGRYVESDPVGLSAGPNTFSYVKGNALRYIDSLGLDSEVCARPFFPLPIPYARHCFVRFNGDDGSTTSYDSDGVHKDPAPSWWPKTCAPTKGDQDDDCVRREMAKCQASQYDFAKNNCCHCVENALTACGLRPSAPLPNWPINPAPPRCGDGKPCW